MTSLHSQAQSNPLVSIVVPVFNPGDYFQITIKSLLNQSYTNIEIIVVDDGSEKSAKDSISALCSQDERIHLTSMPVNIGGGGARNRALEECRGEFIAFCDSDDIWPSEKLSEQIAFMLRHNVAMCHCDMILVNEIGAPLGERLASSMIDLDEFLLTTSLYCSSVVLKKSVIGAARFGRMRARHPFKFWCEILEKAIVSHNVKTTHFIYRVRKNSVSSNKFRMFWYTLLAYILYSRSPWKTPYYLVRRSLRL
ncbi:MAG: glycosyltransferase family 2 protein [Pseudomonadales bacterium]|nr:glycosyltransferase family 2 protein [Pseudomonadales bacterium]MBO6595976.1 glycosyltransferase family 2 protein [Pseudomonadales bacterium]MBO6822459.1 glycosyltransferase family 2 protein [Pseudomonadales bacterium]